MGRRRMTTAALDPNLKFQIGKDPLQTKILIEEIGGLIRVYEDGRVERPPVVPCVPRLLDPGLRMTCRDVVVDNRTNVWARFYVPKGHAKMSLVVYFHGGGFCVGSAAWVCYHDFLALLAARVGCIIMSVNYSLAPENPLPAAYDDGLKALMWVKQQAHSRGSEWWSRQCDLSTIFLAGDSAGANIAYHVGINVKNSMASSLRPLGFKGSILIQPFFGGEERTESETCGDQNPRSALNLAASDTYWRLSLPPGSNRDHPWCNPRAKGSIMPEELTILPSLVCVSETDILRDRNMELCEALAGAGKKVEHVVYGGVGHAFQVLDKSEISKARSHEMISDIKAFISGR